MGCLKLTLSFIIFITFANSTEPGDTQSNSASHQAHTICICEYYLRHRLMYGKIISPFGTEMILSGSEK